MSKKLNELKQKIDATVQLPLEKAIELVQSMKFRKFTESIDVAVRLGIDSRKSDQNVRGVSNLPNGIGKKIRVAVFADVTNTDEIIKAGALKVGMDDLVEDMKKGNLNYDRVIATPAAMKLVGKLGQLLGPKGLMPNPKTGSVTDDVKGAVEKAIKGQAVFRNDKAGIIHCSVGRISFKKKDLIENIIFLVKDLKRMKPSSAKGAYLKSISISSTMGPGVPVDVQSVAE